MSKQEPKQRYQFEWSFGTTSSSTNSRVRNSSECLSSGDVIAKSSSATDHHRLPPLFANAVTSKHDPHAAHHHNQQPRISYSGPTLWNPRYHRRSPDKFLTLTPLRSDPQQSTDSSLPVITITPRRGSREFSFLWTSKADTADFGQQQCFTPTLTFTEKLGVAQNIISADVSKNLGLVSVSRKNKKKPDRVSIFPDVFAVVRSPRRADKASTSTSSNVNGGSSFIKGRSKDQGSTSKSDAAPFSKRLVKYNRASLDIVTLASLEHAFNRVTAVTADIPDKNIQDQGTLFSRQQAGYYNRLAKEPTVLIPPPVGFRYVFPKENKKLNPGGREDKADDDDNKCNRSRILKDRRSYVQWNVHRNRSKRTGDTDSSSNSFVSQTQNTRTTNDRTDNILCAQSKGVKTTPRISSQDKRDTTSTTGSKIAAQFCDVLGHKTCQRCREFYAKNFKQPPKETMAKIRTNSPLTRENSIVLPTVGLQKIVIRIKDENGRMEVASEDVNRELL